MPSSHSGPDASRADGENPDPQAIRQALHRVLESPQFRSSERIRAFLGFVVEETLAGHANQIKAYSIAVDCFRREPDFDPQLDPYVRIVARRLRRALNHYYVEDGATDPLLIDIPKGSYVPRFVARETTGAVPATMPARATGDPTTTEPAAIASTVAVVRLEAHGSGDDQAFLAGGLTQEIILALSRFSEVLVIGPITMAHGEPRDSSPRDIGRGHDADFVLMGTVQKLGDRLRISVSLSNVASSNMVWAQRYERDLTVADLFAVQDEIASEVAATIGDAAGVIVRQVAERTRGRHPADLSSYEAALRGLHWGLELTETDFVAAHEALEHAVRSDPHYALSRALLSDMYFSDWVSGVDRFEGALDRAASLAGEAVAIDAFCSDAHWALAQVHYGRRELDAFHAQFEAARTLNPNKALYLASYGLFLVGLQSWDKAVDLTETAIQLNPQHPTWYHLVPTMNRARLGEWEQSYAGATAFTSGDLMWGPLLRTMTLGHLDRASDVEKEVEALLAIQPRFVAEGRALMERLLYAEKNIDLVVDGLARAGLKID